jgi:hypothetical protein
MRRFLVSLTFGVVVGLTLGLFLGWGPFPVEYSNSPATALAQTHKDDYVVMVADGFLVDADVTSALERMRVLEVENIPEYVQSVTERYISNSRDLDDIRSLVGLSEALGRLTPIMEPYRDVTVPGADTP